MIKVETSVKAPLDKVWEYWSNPEHITKWCQASDDWHAPHAENDLQNGGRFKTVMSAKDGSFSFDFEGVYHDVDKPDYIRYTLDDGRKVEIIFKAQGDHTKITESFEAEKTNSEVVQKAGWQAILDSFKKYTENN
ncbi:MAG: SRPBCC domain-containing protein [Pedobacter sp.]